MTAIQLTDGPDVEWETLCNPPVPRIELKVHKPDDETA
ncbi:hypothetical protein J2S55_008493 [Streptosporangium brasiliense]|uniref:Uncharacterized protein n=1 Tax=Streptosporangium brasiliense TaxID=47480 RepID=A0ABT9RK54_9ACTN|nr:hypothetical protein [Streptosporangium brasiliense]